MRSFAPGAQLGGHGWIESLLRRNKAFEVKSSWTINCLLHDGEGWKRANATAIERETPQLAAALTSAGIGKFRPRTP